MDDTIVFIDSGFLSKLTKYLGAGKHLRYDLIKLSDKSGTIIFSQKAVDTLMVMDIMSLPIKNKEIKKIILIACDSDFVPVIDSLRGFGVETILYTYFTKRRDTNFSRSSHLMKVVSKYIRLKKEDFESSPLDKGEDKTIKNRG